MIELDAGERAVLMQLDRVRQTEDGAIIGKAQRDRLIAKGLAFRAWGHTTLTPDGDAIKARLLTRCEHEWQGWRDLPGGNGGEQFCSKCGLGALAWSLSLGEGDAT